MGLVEMPIPNFTISHGALYSCPKQEWKNICITYSGYLCAPVVAKTILATSSQNLRSSLRYQKEC
jgi:hypothetical protein